MSKHFLSGSIILLSIAIFFLAFQLSNSASVSREAEEPVISMDNGLLTIKETAMYLSMDVDRFTRMIEKQSLERAQLTSFDTYLFVPYIEMNGEKYFSKKQLDEWIDYNIVIWQNL